MLRLIWGLVFHTAKAGVLSGVEAAAASHKSHSSRVIGGVITTVLGHFWGKLVGLVSSLLGGQQEYYEVPEEAAV